MFEEYIFDANYFYSQAQGIGENEIAKRYYRASIISLFNALEAFVNNLAESFASDSRCPNYEIAFLLDKKFEIVGDCFDITDRNEFHRLEDKLKFLLKKFVPGFDISKRSSWSDFLEIKKVRDNLVHSRKEEDENTIEAYNKLVKRGLASVIEIMDCLIQSLYGKPLRKKIKELGS